LAAAVIYNEQELLQQVSLGNEEAFRELFTAWHHRLSGYMYRITESRELTQDIVQEVFLKIWMSREALAEVNNFKNYLFVIARNMALNELRKIATRLRYENNLTDQEITTEEPEEYYQTLIDEAVNQLPGRQREVWLLSRQDRLTYQQVADQLQVSKDTVKTHLRLASGFINQYLQSKISVLILLAAFYDENFF
jgi:RNA polymerase sigma-70 factor (family 1)